MSLLRPSIAFAVCCSTTVGQNPVWEIGASATMRPATGSLAVLEDHDGDGVDDVLTTFSRQRIENWYVFWDSQIQLRSGRTGAPLVIGPAGMSSSSDVFGASSAGDLDGDGFADIVFAHAGLIPGRAVIAWSPRRRVELWRVPLPHWFVFAPWMGGDLDGDGRRDLVIGMMDRILVFDAFRMPLYQRSPPPGIEFWGLTAVGDLDGDQREDFAVGLRQMQACALISGATGQVLRVLGSTASGQGWPYGSIGDLDGDDRADFAVGYHGPSGYRMEIHSSASLRVLFGSVGLTHSVLGDVDLDHDGVDDWLVIDHVPGSVTTPDLVRTRMLSRRHGEVAWELRHPAGAGGRPVVVGRNPGSPYPLVVLNGYNRLQAIEATLPGSHQFGSGCRRDGLPPPRIGLHGIVEPTVGMRVTLAGAEPGALALLALDLPPVALPQPLGPIGFAGCELMAQPELAAVRIVGSAGHDRGYTSVVLPAAGGMPAMAAGQWICLWPGSGGILEYASSAGHTLPAP